MVSSGWLSTNANFPARGPDLRGKGGPLDYQMLQIQAGVRQLPDRPIKDVEDDPLPFLIAPVAFCDVASRMALKGIPQDPIDTNSVPESPLHAVPEAVKDLVRCFNPDAFGIASPPLGETRRYLALLGHK